MTLDDIRKKLLQVPWSRLGTAPLTSGAKIPDAILGLCSSSESKRECAYWQLDNVVVVQSELYEAAYYVVPFVFELLDTEYPCKGEVYELLIQIANGSSAPGRWVRLEDGVCLRLDDACRALISERIAVVTRDACDPKLPSPVRESSNLLLGMFPEVYDTWAPVLRQALALEQDEAIRSLMSGVLVEGKTYERPRRMSVEEYLKWSQSQK